MKFYGNNYVALLLILSLGVLLAVPLIVLAVEHPQLSSNFLPIVISERDLQDTTFSAIPETAKEPIAPTAIPLPTTPFTITSPVPFDKLPLCPDNSGVNNAPINFDPTIGCRAVSTVITSSDNVIIISLPARTRLPTPLQSQPVDNP